MSVEEELKKDHSDMQAVVDSKQKIIDAQVSPPTAPVATSCQSVLKCVRVAACVLRSEKQRVAGIRGDV